MRQAVHTLAQTMFHPALLWLAQFDLALLALALLVCSAGSYTVTALLGRALDAPPARRGLWLAPLLLCFGADVWATHFIAMLAFEPGPALFYVLDRTLLSIAVAMAGAAPPLALVLLRPRRRFTVTFGGAGLGLAIGAMHFTGMSALRLCGSAAFDPRFGLAGFALGAALAAVMLRQLAPVSGPPRAGRATLALMGAICGLHFTALFGDVVAAGGASVSTAGGAGVASAPGLFAGGSHGLAALVAGVSGLVLLAAFIAALVDHKFALMSQRQAEALNYYAHHDELTRLANRRELREHLARLLARPGQCCMLHYIDIDRFKPVNSLFGHATGDSLLLLVADRLRALAGPDDMLARLGGDEFILVEPLPGAVADFTRAAALVQGMAAPFQLAEGSLCTGASIGLVFAQADEQPGAAALLAAADVALAEAKAQGGGQFCLYHPDMSARLAARRQLEGDLGQAVARGEMLLHYQPLCDAQGVPRGFEALLRWQHSTRGMISPAAFIPFAERSGHIRAIGLFVLEQACRAAMLWPAELRVAVNISAVQLRDESLFEAIKTILARSGLPPRRLELEITESVLIDDAARVSALLRQMHDFGLELAIDDFGTGYSNLSHLRDFCAGRLKIDRSFIAGLRNSSEAASIVHAIAGLGHALGMEVLAEGVETESELRLARAMGCDEVQGYYLARPMPEGDIAAWLAAAPRPAVAPPARLSTPALLLTGG